jgi:hypothetical protein
MLRERWEANSAVLGKTKKKHTVETNGSAIGIQVQDAWVIWKLQKKMEAMKEPQDIMWTTLSSHTSMDTTGDTFLAGGY